MNHHIQKKVLRFLEDLHRVRSQGDLISFLLAEIVDLIPCHNRGIARYDPQRRTILQMNLHLPFSNPAFLDSVRDGGTMVPEHFWQVNPDERYPIRQISEVLSYHAWLSHPMYCEFFGSEGLVDCLTLEFGSGSDRFMFCLHRDRRGFARGEVEIARLLAPHLEQAFENSRIADTLCLSPPPNEEKISNNRSHYLAGRTPLQISKVIEKNQVIWQRLLGTDLTVHLVELRGWIAESAIHFDCGASEASRNPFILHGPRASLYLRLARNPTGVGFLLLEESILRLHLTARQKEVLHWIALGKTDEEIAIILKMGLGTVREHLRRIYRKCGVTNRTEAAQLLTNISSVPILGDMKNP